MLRTSLGVLNLLRVFVLEDEPRIMTTASNTLTLPHGAAPLMGRTRAAWAESGRAKAGGW